MTDKIPSFKEQIDDIHVPTEKLDAVISKVIQEHEPKKRKSLKNKLIYTASAAVVTLGVLIGSATVSPAMANIVSKIPIIGSVFSESDDTGLAQVSNLGLTQKINQSKTVKGDTLTIEEVFYDGTRFSVSYTLDSQKPLGEYYFMQESGDISMTINGKTINYGSSLGETEITPTYRTGILEIGGISDLPEAFDLELTFQGEGNKKWKFKIPVQAQTDVKFIELNHQQSTDQIVLSIPNVKISPAGLNFSYEAFSTGINHFTALINFKIVDDSGTELVGRFGGGSTETVKGVEHSKADFLFEPVSDEVRELTITPYLQSPSEGSVEFDQDGNEVQTEFHSGESKAIEFESFTVKIPRND